MMTEWLTGIDIGQVNFNGGNVNGLQRIMERHRRVRVGSAIDDDAGGLALRLVNPADQFAFRVGLPENNLQPKCLGFGHTAHFQVTDGFLALDRGLAQAEEVEVGSV